MSLAKVDTCHRLRTAVALENPDFTESAWGPDRKARASRTEHLWDTFCMLSPGGGGECGETGVNQETWVLAPQKERA